MCSMRRQPRLKLLVHLDQEKYPNFQKDLKRVQKKHKQAIKDIELWEKGLANSPLFAFGNRIPGMPDSFPPLWKFRIALKSENIGQRGGLRMICAESPDGNLAALCLYCKSDQDSQPPLEELKNWLSGS